MVSNTPGFGPPQTPSSASGNAMAVGAMVMWAACFPAAELLLETWPPIALIVVRMAVALIILLPLWWITEGGEALRMADWDRALLVGGLGFGYGTYLLLVAQALTDPVTVALIIASTPIAATLIELGHGLRRLRWTFVLGLAATVVGGAIATYNVQVPQLGLGLLCAVGSCFLLSWGSFAAVRDLTDMTTLGRAAATVFGAFVMVSLLYVIHGLAGLDVAAPSDVFTWSQIGAFAIYGIGGMALSQLLFIASVGKIGIALTAFHINLTPFYVMLIMLAMGAAWSWQHAIGAAVVALGVILSQIRFR